MVLLGIDFSSVVVGFLSCRRAVFIQLGAVADLLAGLVVAWLAATVFQPEMGMRAMLPLGAAAGGVAGTVIAVLFNWAWGLAYRWAPRRGAGCRRPLCCGEALRGMLRRSAAAG